MRWSKIQPKHGDQKTTRWFAYLPTRIGDHVVWWEHYRVCWIYDCSVPSVILNMHGWKIDHLEVETP